MEVSQLLLETLEVLGDDDFKTFKWYLTEGSDSWDAIPVYRLEKAPRTETASLMTQAYGDDSAVNITAEILGKMNKKVVAEKLKKTYAGAVDGDLVKFTNKSKLNLCFHVSYCLTVSVFFFSTTEGRAPAAVPAAGAAAAAAPAAVSAVGGSVVFAPTVTGSSTGTWNVTINK